MSFDVGFGVESWLLDIFICSKHSLITLDSDVLGDLGGSHASKSMSQLVDKTEMDDSESLCSQGNESGKGGGEGGFGKGIAGLISCSSTADLGEGIECKTGGKGGLDKGLVGDTLGCEGNGTRTG